MRSRPHVLVTEARSLDGYLDDMSDQADLDRIDEVRADVDTILVGANTIRRDTPRLLVRSVERQEQRVRRGLPPPVPQCGPADEIHPVIAPFFVGDPDAPRFVRPGQLPQNSENPTTPAEIRQIGDVVLLRYLASAPGAG